MLFVNIDPGAAGAPYANTFPEGGRRLVWFPSAGQSARNPVIRRMLGMPAAPAASEGQLVSLSPAHGSLQVIEFEQIGGCMSSAPWSLRNTNLMVKLWCAGDCESAEWMGRGCGRGSSTKSCSHVCALPEGVVRLLRSAVQPDCGLGGRQQRCLCLGAPGATLLNA